MAKTYRPYVPEQDLLLPPSLRDWLPENHLAYFVSDLIDRCSFPTGRRFDLTVASCDRSKDVS